MAKEVRHAALIVPRMMIGTIVLNGILGFAMTVTLVFCIQNLEIQVVDSTAVYPFVDIFATAVDSEAGAIGMTIPVIVLSIYMCLNAVAAASRQAWSFARDDGLPFRAFFCKVTTILGTPLPVNAIVSSLGILICLSLINLGGTEAFNSIYGLVTGAVGMTYALSIGCVFWRRLFGAALPPARWSLGKYGVYINGFAFFFELFTTCISFFPLFAKITAETMNWGIAMFGGVAALCAVNYFVASKRAYKGPVFYLRNDSS